MSGSGARGDYAHLHDEERLEIAHPDPVLGDREETAHSKPCMWHCCFDTNSICIIIIFFHSVFLQIGTANMWCTKQAKLLYKQTGLMCLRHPRSERPSHCCSCLQCHERKHPEVPDFTHNTTDSWVEEIITPQPQHSSSPLPTSDALSLHHSQTASLGTTPTAQPTSGQTSAPLQDSSCNCAWPPCNCQEPQLFLDQMWGEAIVTSRSLRSGVGIR